MVSSSNERVHRRIYSKQKRMQKSSVREKLFFGGEL